MFIVLKLRRRLFCAAAAALALVSIAAGAARSFAPDALGAAKLSGSAGEPLTVVIDAGHGGEDGGAVSPNGVAESGLNLSIARRLEAMMLLFGVPAVMTRASDEIEYPEGADTVHARKAADTRARVELIESVDNALLVSIHQNKYTSSSPFGAQALFAGTQGSRELAERLQAGFIAYLDPKNRRAAAPIQESIYIMNHVTCTAVLVECGFLSNPADEARLCSDAYQIKLSAVIAACILTSGGENEVQNGILLH